MTLTNREIEQLYDRCRTTDRFPDCEIESKEKIIVLKGTLPNYAGYITVEFEPVSVNIETEI